MFLNSSPLMWLILLGKHHYILDACSFRVYFDIWSDRSSTMIDIFTSFLPSLNPLILPVKWRDRLPSHFVEVWGTNAFYISLILDSFPYLEQQKTRQMIVLSVLVNVRTWNKAESLDPGAENTQGVCFLRRGPWLKSEPWKEEEEGFLCREVEG